MLDDFAGNQFDGGKMLEILKALELDQQGQTAFTLRANFVAHSTSSCRGVNEV